jgi:hypothetical protein
MNQLQTDYWKQKSMIEDLEKAWSKVASAKASAMSA